MSKSSALMSSSNPPLLGRRPKSQSSTHSAHSHHRVRNPFRRRRSSDSGGSSSEYDPTDTVPHVAKSFDKSLSGDEFKTAALSLLHKLAVPQWRSIPIEFASIIQVRKIYGALTNTIYQLVPPNSDEFSDRKGMLPRAAPKLLLRIYGAHVEHLIDRTHELATLKRLSKHNIGPLLLGTFTNGRFEQWLDSHTLSRLELRDPNLSCSIARRMRELHDGVRLTFTERNAPPTVWTSLDKWLPRAREIIARRRKKPIGRLSDKNLPTLAKLSELKLTDDSLSDDLILGQKWTMFELALGRYKLYMEEVYPPEKLRFDLAFCHNDAQYGNILKIENQEQLRSPDQRHRQLVVIDFEYAAPNPRAYDLANHFCEWMYNYHSNTPHIPNLGEYPTIAERFRFLEAYVAHGSGTKEEKEETVKLLEKEIKEWRVVNHAFWCAWGVVMSEDDPELMFPNGTDLEDEVVREERPLDSDQGATAADFDYIAYADQKMRLFWGELVSGRMIDDYKDGINGAKFIEN